MSAAIVFLSAAIVFLISCHRLLASNYCFRASTAIGGIRAKGQSDGHRAHRARAARIFDSDGIEVNLRAGIKVLFISGIVYYGVQDLIKLKNLLGLSNDITPIDEGRG